MLGWIDLELKSEVGGEPLVDMKIWPSGGRTGRLVIALLWQAVAWRLVMARGQLLDVDR